MLFISDAPPLSRCRAYSPALGARVGHINWWCCSQLLFQLSSQPGNLFYLSSLFPRGSDLLYSHQFRTRTFAGWPVRVVTDGGGVSGSRRVLSLFLLFTCSVGTKHRILYSIVVVFMYSYPTFNKIIIY